MQQFQEVRLPDVHPPRGRELRRQQVHEPLELRSAATPQPAARERRGPNRRRTCRGLRTARPDAAASRRGCRCRGRHSSARTPAGTRGRLRQLVDHTARAVLLLRRDVQQDVAVREQLVQPCQVAPLRLGFGGVGIGTVEDHHVPQDGRGDLDEPQFVERQAELCVTSVSGWAIRTGRVVVGLSRPLWCSRDRPGALTSVLLPVPVPPNVATTSGAASRVRSVSRRPRKPPEQSPAVVDRLPRRLGLRPAMDPAEQIVDPRERLQLIQVGDAHALSESTRRQFTDLSVSGVRRHDAALEFSGRRPNCQK